MNEGKSAEEKRPEDAQAGAPEGEESALEQETQIDETAEAETAAVEDDSVAAEAAADVAEEVAVEEAPVEEAAVEEEAVEEEAVEVEAAESEPAEAPDAVENAVESPSEAAPAAAEPPGVPGLDWYIIHTYSGFENKVKESLRTRGEAFGYGERIGEILIPTEDVIELKAGKKVTSKRLLYPGYVLVQLDLDDELWHVVKNTPRVTGFVGSSQIPNPLTADEVNAILYRQTTSSEKPRPKMTFEKSDRVKIVDGPFSNFTGSVEEVNVDKSTLKVMVTIFGRGTPVELEYTQVEKEQF